MAAPPPGQTGQDTGIHTGMVAGTHTRIMIGNHRKDSEGNIFAMGTFPFLIIVLRGGLQPFTVIIVYLKFNSKQVLTIQKV